MKNMKIVVCALAILAASAVGCTDKKEIPPLTTAVSSATTVNYSEIQSELSEMKSKYESVTKIYDGSIEAAINQYCEKYLSFRENSRDAANIKDVVTENYYKELSVSKGHQTENAENRYEQATGVDSLYFSNYAAPSNEVSVTAFCKQTVIYKNKTTTSDIAYVFELQYTGEKWKIASAATKISETKEEN